MTPRQLRDFCLSFPGAVEEFPFGPETHVFKANAKIFAISAMAAALKVSLKCDPDLAADLRRSYPDVVPGYHLNKRHWNTVTCNASVPDRLVRDMIEDSYDAVTGSRARPSSATTSRRRAARPGSRSAPDGRNAS